MASLTDAIKPTIHCGSAGRSLVETSRGLLITYSLSRHERSANVTAVGALLSQHAQLVEVMGGAAPTHRIMPLAGDEGMKATHQIQLSDQAAPLRVLRQSAVGTVSSDNFDAAAPSKDAAAVPHGADAINTLTSYTQATDFAPSAQANLAGGNSPAWHGQSADATGHANAAALSGIKTQGFDGNGHNQLVFDDSDGQGRAQMATTQAATQLNLGHLIHQADNYRGSFRGSGIQQQFGLIGFAHEGAYRDSGARTVTLYAIQKIAARAKVTA